MENSDVEYNVISQETENFIIHDIISQFMPMKNETNESKEDISKISYNDYYINQGVDYIKRNVKLNDPLMNLIFEEEAKNLKTPLDEWELNDFKGKVNNIEVGKVNKTLDLLKFISYYLSSYTYSLYYQSTFYRRQSVARASLTLF